MEEFIQSRLYLMPPTANNPLCWKVRCDTVIKEYWTVRGLPERSPRYLKRVDVEDNFWRILAKYLLGDGWAILFEGYIFPRVFESSVIKEKTHGLSVERVTYVWSEHTYELQGVGYNGNPPNPW